MHQHPTVSVPASGPTSVPTARQNNQQLAGNRPDDSSFHDWRHQAASAGGDHMTTSTGDHTATGPARPLQERRQRL
eukprot:12776027-Alexandrium_andersonii.AAC.1